MSLRSEYKYLFSKERRRALLVAVFILLLSLVCQYYAGEYSANRSSQFVGDVILDNVPVVNVNPIIIEGALLAVAGGVVLILFKPRYIIFTLKAAGVFLAIRAFFITITHLGIYPGQLVPSTGYFDQLYATFGLETGYFFSAHTGLPIFMALIFWRERLWRILFLILAAVFGVSVLLAHVHYSIDVFAAPFMAYSIFRLAGYLFRDDYRAIFR